MTAMHSEQVIRPKALTLATNRSDDRTPVALWDAAALLPLRDSPGTLVDVDRHLGDGFPDSKHIVEGFHETYFERDRLSRQEGRIGPVTKKRHTRTMCPMGRGVTPAKFKDGFAERLRAARIAAGFSTQRDFAEKSGIPFESYKKYEQGRTVMPPHHIQAACAYLEKDANYLFQVPAIPSQASKRNTA